MADIEAKFSEPCGQPAGRQGFKSERLRSWHTDDPAAIRANMSRGDTSEDFEVDTSNEVLVTMTIGNIDRKNCDVLAPRIAKRLLTILGQDQRAQR